MLLRKQVKLSEVKLEMKSDGSGGFAGYASVFGGVDSYGDTIVKGAFEYSLGKYGKPKMFALHDWFDLPIGKYTVAKEDDQGLYVEGEFTPGLARASDTRAAMQHGTLDGLSIGGYVKSGDYDETDTGRVIRRWTKLVEVSPVVFPADESARVAEVRSRDQLIDAIDSVDSIRDFETLLRDAAGLTKAAAEALAARAKLIFMRGDPVDDRKAAAQRLHERLARLAAGA
jgi:HK97 family phage prohead protease